ncbi:MAG: HAD-IIIA family hydrolase [Humidesulfovibrio sp.]|uniref:HAD-IIIA family hydrolase n=1 Tax=Humidesulfovibrio sp. TaxID=2910988 RepID=UPI0027EAA4EF|nr:HAD-IIIA family hydrolase [Humidesulfovibrio sp.]MDQ7834427.1 HAD-IIIA family hydrolase [Humidesulfovibrio sp.]
MHDVTAYILAGGFGTRLRQVVFDRPKVMAEVLGRPFLYHILDRLARVGIAKAVICTGYMAEQLETAVGSSYRGMSLAYSREETPLGTGGALRLAFERFPARLALAMNGDSLVEADLGAYINWYAEHDFLAALLLVGVDDTSRFGRVDMDEEGRVQAFREKGIVGPGLINAGVYLLRPESLESIQPGATASIETGVFPGLATTGRLGALAVQGRFLDIGTPESYIAAGRFLRESRLGNEQKGRAVFLDRDGTVIAERHYLHDPAGVELLPGAAEGLRAMQSLGLRLVLVTNQSGVGRGYFGRDAVERVHGRLLELLEHEGVDIDAIYLCPHAPDTVCNCRKPKPGLLERAATDLDLDPERSFVIGDKACDVDLGLVMNATTFLVTTGHGAGQVAECGGRAHHVVGSLEEAARLVESILAAPSARGGVEII